MLARSLYEDARRRKEFEHIHKFMEEEWEGRVQLIEFTRAITMQPTAPEDGLLAKADNDSEGSADEDIQGCFTSPNMAKGRKNGYRSRTSVKEMQFRLPLWLASRLGILPLRGLQEDGPYL